MVPSHSVPNVRVPEMEEQYAPKKRPKRRNMEPIEQAYEEYVWKCVQYWADLAFCGLLSGVCFEEDYD
eukprot:Skav225578  [mRNA]  locus=scaffold437:159606:165271:- [translate_table: standard]